MYKFISLLSEMLPHSFYSVSYSNRPSRFVSFVGLRVYTSFVNSFVWQFIRIEMLENDFLFYDYSYFE